MVFVNSIVVKTPYKGNTKYDFWKNIKENQTMIITVDLGYLGKNRGRSYTPKITILNTFTGEQFTTHINKFNNYLNKLEYYE